MKILKFLTLIVMAIFLFTTCEKDRTKYEYKGSNFVHFEARTYETSENVPDIVDIMVNLTSPATTPITVDFAIENSDITKAIAKEGEDYEFITGGTSITFQVGESQKALQFKPVNNIAIGDTTFKELVIKLTGNSAGLTVGFPGSDALNSTAKFKIVDDDCFLEMGNFTGKIKYLVTTKWWIKEEQDCEVVPGDINEPNKISIIVKNGFWESQIFRANWNCGTDLTGGNKYVKRTDGVEGNQTIIILDNTDPMKPKAIIENQYMCRVAWCDGGENDMAIVGTGTFSTCQHKLTVSYTLDWGTTVTDMSSWMKETAVLQFK